MADLRAYARERARARGINEDYFVRQIDQESGFNPQAYNAQSGASGIGQIIPRWHPGVDVWDAEASLDYAAGLVAGYLQQFGSYPKAFAAYNWGSGNVGGYRKNDGTIVPPWDGRRATLPAETRHYLDVILGPSWDKEAPVPSKVNFDPNHPAVIQNDDWSCAPTSLDWAMRSLGRTPQPGWIENDMLRLGLVTRELGLMNHTGSGIVNWLQINDAQHYGSDGYGISNNTNPISWDKLIPEINPRPPYPLLLGLPNWGGPGRGHWSGVRGYDPARGVILLANPDNGATFGHTTLTREQFESKAGGNASIVRVLHPDLLATTPAPPPPPAQTSPTRAEFDAALAPLLALRERLPA